MAEAKKILNIAVKVLTWLLIVFTVFMMVFTIITVTTVDRNDRSIFGVKFYIVQTDSMSKSDKNADLDVHFNAGDIVIIKNVNDFSELKAGSIISFMSTNEGSYGETITHMIREVKRDDDGKLLGYVTYGTNTGVNDEEVVDPEYVLGSYVGKLPGVGNFFAFVKSTPGYIICILVPFLLLILINGVSVIRLFRKYRSEQTADIRAERERIDAERAENQRMMQELLALKAQLEQKNEELSSNTVESSEEISDAAENTNVVEVTDVAEVTDVEEPDDLAEVLDETTETVEAESEDAPAEEEPDENQ